ncbi:hypothetical protein ACVOMS_23595 [Bradyrhizobium guangxiense]
MPVYMIGYDLNHKHISDYEDLFKAIRDVSNNNWWHCLDSTWLITHPGSADAIWKALAPHMHNISNKQIGDKLLVVQVTKDAQWTTSFDEGCHNWLLKHLT